MNASLEPLILDLVESVASAARPYGEVIEAWRTSCPRLTVWEDAIEAGLVSIEPRDGTGLWVAATPLGRATLARRRPARADTATRPRP